MIKMSPSYLYQLYSQLNLYVIVLLFSMSLHVRAEIISDGTVGSGNPGKTLTGPDFIILPNLGKIAGDNLFHSFKSFSLQTGESAIFDGPDSISRIISRVTGGNISEIDGELSSTIPGVDLYFLNSAGIKFGPNASLDIQGSFYASTADRLIFSDNNTFSSTPSLSSTLTSAPPVAFGFLGESSGQLILEKTKLELPESQQKLGLSGSTVHLHGGKQYGEAVALLAGGGVQLAAVTEGEIELSDKISITPDTRGGYLQAEYSALGDQRFKTASSGPVSIYAGEMDLSDSSIRHTKNDKKDTGGIYLHADELSGENIWLDISSIDNAIPGIIEIKAKQASLSKKSLINASTSFGKLAAGYIKLDIADILKIDDSIISTTSNRSSIGRGGDIDIQADRIELNGNSTITSTTFGLGHGGDIRLDSRELIIDKSYIVAGTGPLGILGSPIANEGDGGNIYIQADKVWVSPESEIYNTTTGTGQGGSIFIQSGQFVLDVSTISAASELSKDESILSAGDAGIIDIRSGKIHLTPGSWIKTSATSAGGGNISLFSDHFIHIDHAIVTTTVAGGDGDGGNVTSEASAMVLDRAIITAQADYGSGGNIQFTAEAIFDISPSFFNASSNFGIDGEINFNVPKVDIDSAFKLPTPKFLPSEIMRNCNSRSAKDLSRFILNEKKISSSPKKLKVLD